MTDNKIIHYIPPLPTKMEMSFDEFIHFRNVEIRNINHKRVVRMFYPYLQSVCGVANALPLIISKILGKNFALNSVVTGCFNGAPDGIIAPYGKPDFFIEFNNGDRVYIYGNQTDGYVVSLKNNEYALFVLSDNITNNIEIVAQRHFYMKK